MEKKCDRCERPVKETIHTATDYKIDYYSTHKDGKETVVCTDCKKGTKNVRSK